MYPAILYQYITIKKFFKQAILFHKLLLKKSTYRKTRVYRNVANGNCYKSETKKWWGWEEFWTISEISNIFFLQMDSTINNRNIFIKLCWQSNIGQMHQITNWWRISSQLFSLGWSWTLSLYSIPPKSGSMLYDFARCCTM